MPPGKIGRENREGEESSGKFGKGKEKKGNEDGGTLRKTREKKGKGEVGKEQEPRAM